MASYYNEIDPYAAKWLRNLISAGHIAPGDVDERSIEDVRPDDLRGYVQCHFFAGIGVWSHALRRAGVSDSARVWTGSCPCQPFSAAGKGDGFADERHLWPAFLHLISQREPERVYGEQVASRDADPWIDLVQDDLEALGYAVGAVPFPSAGVGAPHIRDRLYWVADAMQPGWPERWTVAGGRSVARCGSTRVVADTHDARLEGWRVLPERAGQCAAGPHGVAGGLADANGRNACAERQQRSGQQRQQQEDGRAVRMAYDKLQQRSGGTAGGDVPQGRHEESAAVAGFRGDSRPGPVNGFWRSADWLECTDGKWRPVEPGTFPLAHGAPARVGRLRAYGNAINAEAATQFVRATL